MFIGFVGWRGSLGPMPNAKVNYSPMYRERFSRGKLVKLAIFEGVIYRDVRRMIRNIADF
jgi:hypothetical protein